MILSGPRRKPWAMGTLAVLSLLLAPCGGPCDRRDRPADPTTARLMAIGGPASESLPAFDGDGPSAAPLEMDPAILEEEEDGEGFEAPSLAGQPSPFAPPPADSLGAMDGDRNHNNSGRSARSPLLRC
jgi:hypothetical protein